MSVYNGERYLREAIRSVVDQTFSDFEFIIIDDGSIDSTWIILNGWRDPRVRCLRNERRMGLTRSLIRGLQHAQGDYIARIDADDIALPERLKKQCEFLDAHSQTALVGSWVNVIDDEGRSLEIWREPEESHVLRWKLLFKNAIAHSGAMFRKSVAQVVGSYHEGLEFAQDYDLWSRISFAADINTIPEVLVQWRRSKNNSSPEKHREQQSVVRAISKRHIERIIGQTLTVDMFNIIRWLYYPMETKMDVGQIRTLVSVTKTLRDKFCAHFGYVQETIRRDLNREIARQLLLMLNINAYKFRHNVFPAIVPMIAFNTAVLRMRWFPILCKGILACVLPDKQTPSTF